MQHTSPLTYQLERKQYNSIIYLFILSVLGVQHHTCATAVVGDGCTFYQEADLDISIQTIKADSSERNKM